MAKTQGHGNPKWSREEVILALDLYFRLDGKIPDESDNRIADLSEQLRSMPRNDNAASKESFRNKTGVAFKLQNIRQVATGRGLGNVSQTDRDIWAQFGQTPQLVTLIADKIKKSLVVKPDLDGDQDGDVEFSEGALLTRIHKSRERKAAVRKLLISNRKTKGKLQCELCGYLGITDLPELIDAQFEGHHTLPLAESGERKTKISDMALVCASCHRLIHRIISISNAWMSIDEIKKILAI